MKLTNKTVPISVLRMSKYNWKRSVTEEDIEDLATNMGEIGNLHPIIVRPMGKAGSMYEVLAGRRRLEALKLLGHTKVDVRVTKCDDIRAEIISYSENLKVKKPDSREWSAGVKRLVDLYEKLYKVGIPKPNSRAKSKTSGDFCLTANKKSATSTSFMGRPKKPRAQAIKETSKIVGASELTVRRAVKREEDLIPSAARALERGVITQEQADLLATMARTAQKNQLASMVQETREGTRRRMTAEKVRDSEDKLPLIMDMLTSIFLDCKDIKQKLDIAFTAMFDLELDKKRIVNLPNYGQAADVREALTNLLDLIER